MKLDTKALRYLAPEDWRVLTAVSSSFAFLTPALMNCLVPLSPLHFSTSDLWSSDLY